MLDASVIGGVFRDGLGIVEAACGWAAWRMSELETEAFLDTCATGSPNVIDYLLGQGAVLCIC
jgi:hypothetical protein